jgi:hypothetical protein
MNLFKRLLNKTVKAQKKNAALIPIIIINYNRLEDLQNLVDFLLKRNHKNVVVVDNMSTYPPLLQYYEEIGKTGNVTIERMKENYGHMVFWKNRDLYNKYSSGYYVITDSDILPNENLPDDYLTQMIKVLDNNMKLTKVGFALRIDDIPDYFKPKQMVLDWEKRYWEKPLGKEIYKARTDTTFAVYKPGYDLGLQRRFYRAVRIAGNFTASHRGWYVDYDNLTEEEMYYFKTSNSSNSWKIDENGSFKGDAGYLDETAKSNE